MNEQEVKNLEELTMNREKLINELGEKEYARRLGEHVAMLMNNGYVCANFAHNEAYGTFEVNDTLYLNINNIINNCDSKCDEINMQCSELKKNNPILIQYFDLDEQLYYLRGAVDDAETKKIVDEKRRKLEEKIKNILEEDKMGNNVIGKYLELRSKQSEIQSGAYNQMSRYIRQFFYIGSLISDLQSQMNKEGKSKIEQESVLEAYIEGFKFSLNFEELAEVIGGNPIGAQNEFKRIFQAKKDIAQEIASEEQGNKSGLNGLIYQANERYNDFYKILSESMNKKLRIKEKTEEREENDEEIGGIIQGIKKIKLSEIPEGHDFFHFTRETAIPKIAKQGLRGDLENRENAVGKDYENPSIYFSKGETGLLKTVDVWLRWEYGRIAREKKSPDGSMITVPSVLEATFKRVLEDFKERRYFQLDLIEGEDKDNTDFSYDSEDFKKKGAIDNGGPTRRTRWMLGSYTNWETPKLEDWNMMTHVGGRGIGIDRMKMIVTEQGKSDALSVIEEFYERSRNKENIDLRYLDSFIKYVRILTKQQEENLTQKIGKSTVSELSKVEKMDRLTGFFQREAREFNSINDEIEQK